MPDLTKLAARSAEIVSVVTAECLFGRFPSFQTVYNEMRAVIGRQHFRAMLQTMPEACPTLDAADTLHGEVVMNNRRDFLKNAAAAGGVVFAGCSMLGNRMSAQQQNAAPRKRRQAMVGGT